MNRSLSRLKTFRFLFPVLLASFVLGVVGLQAVFIAHTHMMITGQPLLQGQDHHGLSHLPPLFLSRSRLAGSRKSRTIPYSSSLSDSRSFHADSAERFESDTGWDTLPATPFVDLSEDPACYVVVMEAPGLSPSNIEINLRGRDLAIAGRSLTRCRTATGSLATFTCWEKRVRLPGPVTTTGPPVSEFNASGQLRVTIRKADASPAITPGVTML